MKIEFNTNRMPTSKKLAWGVFLVWTASVVFSYILSIFDIETSFILGATTTSLSIILSYYFSKSFFENREIYGKKESGYQNDQV